MKVNEILTENTVTIIEDSAQVFDGANDRTLNTILLTNRAGTVVSYSGSLITVSSDSGVANLDFYTGSMLRYSTTGSAATGLTNNTTYYVIASGLTANAFKVSATDGGSTVDITGQGNDAQYFELATTVATIQATATASLGSGAGGIKSTHAGWVLRTVGTGGRAGRVFTETLVAMGSMTGDQADDIQYPDA